MLNKNIFSYLEILEESGFSSWLTTNGTILTENNIAKILCAPLSRLEVTVLGIEEEECAISSGRSGFDKTIKGVLRLNDAIKVNSPDIDFEVTTYVLDTIKSTEEEIISLWNSHGVSVLGPLPIIDRAGKWEEFDDNIRQSAYGRAGLADFDRTVWCHYPKVFDFLTGNGPYLPCSAGYVDNSSNDIGRQRNPLEEVYDNLSVFLDRKDKNKKCIGGNIMYSDWPLEYFLKETERYASIDAVKASLIEGKLREHS